MRIAAGLVALVLLTGCVSLGDRSSGLEPRIDALMREYSGDVPGASVVVVRNSRVVFRKSYGLANLEDRLQATPDTNYRLASVTKQFTAAAVLMLVDEGKTNLDDPITRTLPELPWYAAEMTIRHLLTHTSGLPDYEDLIPTGQTVQLTDRDVMRLVAMTTAPLFAPGSRYAYSNTGYSLLSLIVERVSGRSFQRFLRERIFAPLGMRDTVAHVEGVSVVKRRAYGYSREGTGFTRTDQSLTSAVLGDGGIYSSIDDLVRWDRAITARRLLSAASWREAQTAQVMTDRPGVSYGMGWRLGQHDGRSWIGHGGETIGFRNAILRFPKERLTVIVLTNRNEGEPWQIALAIADRVPR